MNFTNKLLILIFLASVGLMSYRVTLGYFSDTETSIDNTFTAAASYISSPSPSPSVSPSPSPENIANHVVISEVQIDGGTGSANDNDFIELYNPTNSPISLNGMRLVKRAGGGPNDVLIVRFTSSHNITAHGYFLWGHVSGGGIPNTFGITIGANVTSSDTLSSNDTAILRNGLVDSGVVVDSLSWGSAAFTVVEGSAFATNPDVNQSIERKAYSTSTVASMLAGDATKGNGYDTNNNANDFTLRSVSQPQNSGSGTETP